MGSPPATSPPSFEEKARRDPRLPLLVVLGLLGFGIVFVPAAAFAAPALCIALGVSAGGLFGQRAGIVISVYVCVMFVTAAAFGLARASDAALWRPLLAAVGTLLAGICVGRAAELLRSIQLRAMRRTVTCRHASDSALLHAALLRVVPDAVCTLDRAGTVLDGHGQLSAATHTNLALAVGK